MFGLPKCPQKKMSKKLEDYTTEELIGIIEGLKQRKKFGLVWEDKPEEVAKQCQEALPVLEEITDKAITKSDLDPTNFIIEGDNYHALSVLNYTHAGKIDVIYIDPPYNTGEKDFIYNDRYVDREDTYRHSKWLSFMSKRLELAKSLMTENGVIFISIGEDEYAQLKILADTIFGEENYITNFIWEKTQHFGRQKVNFYSNADYILTYAKRLKVINKKELLVEKVKSEFEDAPLFNASNPTNTLTFPKGSVKFNIADGEYTATIDEKYKLINKVVVKKGYNVVPFSLRFRSRWSQKRVEEELAKGTTFWVKSSNFAIRAIYASGKLFNESPKQILFTNTNNEFCAISRFGVKVGVNEEGSAELNSIVGAQNSFSYPKPKSLIAYLVSLYHLPDDKHHPDDITVLDFFAGSGTTGHAVMQLNKDDGGKRRFILVTNNENDIANSVTYPRINNAINGYAKVGGIPTNLRYFRTSFVSKEQTDDQTRVELVARSTEMICLREDTFEKILDTKEFKVFCGAKHYTAIIFDPEAIELLKDALQKFEDDKPVHIYIFSLSNDIYESDFANLERTHELRPIPESILEVYRRIFGSQNGVMGAYD